MPNNTTLDVNDLYASIECFWSDQILGTTQADGLLCGADKSSCDPNQQPFPYYLTLKCITPQYDPDWSKTQPPAICQALKLAKNWIMKQSALNAEIHVGLSSNSPCRNDTGSDEFVTEMDTVQTPVMLVHIPGTAPQGNILMYSHLDKQAVTPANWTVPPNVPSEERPFTPYLDAKQQRLYARGSTDDGFAMFFAIAAVMALNDKGVPYPSINLLVDFDEEGGSENLPIYIAKFSDIIGTPDLSVLLDASVGDYEGIWLTSSERTAVIGTLTVKMLTKAVHSGDGTRVVANPNRIVRILLNRLENPDTGELYPWEFHVSIPPEQEKIIKEQAERLGYKYFATRFPWCKGAYPISVDPEILFRNRTWEGGLAITGVCGLPSTDNANNVVVSQVSYKLSLRLPPPVDPDRAQSVLKHLLEAEPPYGATVTYTPTAQGAGWVSPPLQPWLSQAIDKASMTLFNNNQPHGRYGDGGTLPLAITLQQMFPDMQFMVTGVAGPDNNQHAADENLYYPYAQKVAACIAYVLSQLPDNAGG
jgi:acetylornithine deacetylase/succinyl-diaminopimelate desuccinylase-like protein